MAISGIGSNYSNVYGSTYTAQKNEAVKKTETKETASAQAGNVKNTSTDNVSDYYSVVLQIRCTSSMQIRCTRF